MGGVGGCWNALWNGRGKRFRQRKTLETAFLAKFRGLLEWARQDSNLRRRKPTGLQPVPIGRSGTRPGESRIVTTRVIFANDAWFKSQGRRYSGLGGHFL